MGSTVEKFENEPIIGVYPVPQKFSFWKGNTNQNATAMDYALSISYYQNVLWDEITVDKEITIPNIDNFNRTKYHYSNLCFGASLKALIKLMKKKNYVFLGTDLHSINAFFVQKKYLFTINQAVSSP